MQEDTALNPFLGLKFCVVTKFYRAVIDHVYLFMNLRNLLYVILNIEGCTVKDINVSSGTGRVKMQLKNSLADYYMELDAGVGGIIYNGKEINGNYVQNGKNGRCIIDSGVGKVELTDPQKER